MQALFHTQHTIHYTLNSKLHHQPSDEAHYTIHNTQYTTLYTTVPPVPHKHFTINNTTHYTIHSTLQFHQCPTRTTFYRNLQTAPYTTAPSLSYKHSTLQTVACSCPSHKRSNCHTAVFAHNAVPNGTTNSTSPNPPNFCFTIYDEGSHTEEGNVREREWDKNMKLQVTNVSSLSCDLSVDRVMESWDFGPPNSVKHYVLPSRTEGQLYRGRSSTGV